MIANQDDELKLDDELVVDIGRPSFTEEDEFARWGLFHEWVKDSDTPVFVNGVFWNMDGLIAKKQGYLGGGFSYKFWFAIEDDRQSFLRKVIEIWRDGMVPRHIIDMVIVEEPT